ncbi:uridine kinase (plasmid) [Rhizobium ruizarguesonis]|uniref:(d)CMP kinase n=2 Tax=Rhizobium TaxID=379 RepID=A0A179C070_RHILE|nr:AAA family ATPase [Rhizobium leguminosarum]OAP96830.1 hypothetical protein A4U53_37450 [Rhizobium leguminosarum]
MPRVPNDPTELVALIAARVEGTVRPFVVALDGRSGAGKSTLARALAESLGAAIVEGDDFYAGGIELRDDSAETRAAAWIDWTRQHAVLETLHSRHEAVWRAFDWEAFDGRLCDRATKLSPKQIIIFEGVYAARPELARISHSARGFG